MVIRIARWLVIAALIIGYPLLAHYTNESTEHRDLGAALAIAPVIVIALVLAWRSSQRIVLLGVTGLVCLALWLAWPALATHYDVVYWLQHAGTQLLLFIVFGRTLLAGQLPLCTRMARAHHAPLTLTPAHEHYARQVTWAWTIFFAVMGLLSTALFFLAPLSAWSVFANFLTPLLIAAMFAVEYYVRYRLLPHLPRARLLDAVRAFRDSSGHSG